MTIIVGLIDQGFGDVCMGADDDTAVSPPPLCARCQRHPAMAGAHGAYGRFCPVCQTVEIAESFYKRPYQPHPIPPDLNHPAPG